MTPTELRDTAKYVSERMRNKPDVQNMCQWVMDQANVQIAIDAAALDPETLRTGDDCEEPAYRPFTGKINLKQVVRDVMRLQAMMGIPVTLNHLTASEIEVRDTLTAMMRDLQLIYPPKHMQQQQDG